MWERTSNDFYSGSVASVYHVFILFFATALRLELVADDLVVGPPLTTLNMFTDGVHLDVTVSYATGSALVGMGLSRWWVEPEEQRVRSVRSPAGPMKFLHSLAIESQFHWKSWMMTSGEQV